MTISDAPPSVYDLIARIYRQHHRERLTAVVVDEETGEETKHEPSFAALFKSDGVTHGGYPAAATVRIVSLRDRAVGVADVMVMIDEAEWKHANAAAREALIDHELEHVELTPPGRRGPLDDLGRPRLRLRKHDFQIGGFHDIVSRHGASAWEAKALAVACAPHKQLVIPWVEGAALAGELADRLRPTGTDGVNAVTITNKRTGKSVTLTAKKGGGKLHREIGAALESAIADRLEGEDD